jgi:hypothetical protein
VPAALPLDRTERHRRIAAAGSLLVLLDQPDGRAVLEAEADDPAVTDRERLLTRAALDHLLMLRANRDRSRASLGFLGTDDVLIVPGFMGSALKDVSGPHGLIWIDPRLFLDEAQIAALRLAEFQRGKPDQDIEAGVRIDSPGAVPAIYDVLWADLNFRLYDAQIFPFDWRKDIERSALLLADRIRNRLGRPPRPLHVIAHSQGTLVARRAIQMLGADQARKLVNHLVLLDRPRSAPFPPRWHSPGAMSRLQPPRNMASSSRRTIPRSSSRSRGCISSCPGTTDSSRRLIPRSTRR